MTSTVFLKDLQKAYIFIKYFWECIFHKYPHWSSLYAFPFPSGKLDIIHAVYCNNIAKYHDICDRIRKSGRKQIFQTLAYFTLLYLVCLNNCFMGNINSGDMGQVAGILSVNGLHFKICTDSLECLNTFSSILYIEQLQLLDTEGFPHIKLLTSAPSTRLCFSKTLTLFFGRPIWMLKVVVLLQDIFLDIQFTDTSWYFPVEFAGTIKNCLFHQRLQVVLPQIQRNRPNHDITTKFHRQDKVLMLKYCFPFAKHNAAQVKYR